MALAGFNGQVQDLSGNAVATVSIEVRRESDNGLASLFEDADGVTPLGNPFANDPGDVGHFLFHVAGGSYRIRAFTVEGDVMLWRHVGIGTMAQHDVEEFLPVTGGTLTAAAFPTLTIERTTALTNALQGALRLLTTTSGVMADGFATGFNFALQDDNDVVNDVATVSARRAGADNTGSLVFSTFNAGVLGDRVVIDHATFTYNGTAVLTGGKHTIWIPASAMRARASNGAEPATAFSGANANEFSVFNFDQTTMEGVFFNIAMPKGWDEGNLTFIPIWSALAGSTRAAAAWPRTMPRRASGTRRAPRSAMAAA